MINLYYSLIYPFLVHIWGGTSYNNLRPLHVLQKRAVRLITNNDSINPDGSRIHSSPLFYETGILTIYDIFKLQLAIFIFKCLNHYNPPQFSNYYSYVSDDYNTSSSRKKLLRTPMARTSKYGLNSIKCLGAKIWNDIPLELRESSSANLFKTILKRHLLSSYIDS